MAIDALEYDLVERFNTVHLKQGYYGKTDISEFSETRTVVIWSSFITGRNMEAEILARGQSNMWSTAIRHEDTFFSQFEDPYIIDLPGYNYDIEHHAKERELLRAFFDACDVKEKEAIRRKYNSLAFEHHRRVKEEFLEHLNMGHDFLLGYFSIADVIGHLNFGNTPLMRMIYGDLDEIASKINGTDQVIVLSDHGMKAVGQFGDHSEYGFWSTNFADLGRPKITDFAGIIMDLKKSRER